MAIPERPVPEQPPSRISTAPVIVIGALLVTLGILYIVLNPGFKPNNSVTPTPVLSPNSTGSDQNKFEEYSISKPFTGFPTDIPMPANAAITQNLKMTLPDGRVQLTKYLVSKKSINENYQFYLNNLTDSKTWVIKAKFDDSNMPSIKVIYAESLRGVLSINIKTGSQTGETAIDLTFSQSK